MVLVTVTDVCFVKYDTVLDGSDFHLLYTVYS